ncbi:hypothetical protein GF351_01710 [Candidatus Woesearchaeota archaeon]|nr:hypothetical protein [Candidatus Woesearchaeota archaeon]
MRHNRKASLQLGINAIVILILAVTMLGLGLAFLKGMFGQTSEQFIEISRELERQMRNELEKTAGRLVMSTDSVQIKKGESETIYIGLRNDLGGTDPVDFSISYDDEWSEDYDEPNINTRGIYNPDEDGNAGPPTHGTIQCYDAISSTARDQLRNNPGVKHIDFETSTVRTLADGDIEIMPMLIQATSAAERTTYTCAVVIVYDTDDQNDPYEIYTRERFFVEVTG